MVGYFIKHLLVGATILFRSYFAGQISFPGLPESESVKIAVDNPKRVSHKSLVAYSSSHYDPFIPRNQLIIDPAFSSPLVYKSSI